VGRAATTRAVPSPRRSGHAAVRVSLAGIVSRLWPFFRRFLRYRWTLLAGFLTVPIGAGLDIWLTLLIGDALNRLRGAGDTEFLRALFASLIAIAFVRGVFRFLQRWLIVGVSREVERDLKQDLFDKLTRLPFAYHNRAKSGDVVSRVTSDVENLRMFLGPGLMYVLGALTLVPASAFVLVKLAPTLTLWMLVPILAMIVGMRLLVPRLHRVSNLVQESLAEISHVAQESFAGVRVVKVDRQAPFLSKRPEQAGPPSRQALKTS